ncbi:MAG: putative PEP-binding protein, partial [Bdellovibrionota bacterium]
IDAKAGHCTINGKEITTGTKITLEAGADGKLFLGEGTLTNLSFQEGIIKDVSALMSRVIKQECIPVEVRVNINSAKDAEVGLSFGADGVGLCRTENMFMEQEALREIRNIVFTGDPKLCTESFEKLEQVQFRDFQKIFAVMKDRVVNIRLMDLPLHDFVPQTEADFRALADQLKHLDEAHLRAAAEGLREHNPMLGLRACRFGIINPQVYDLQMRAIIRAAYTVAQDAKVLVNPGIMFPLVFTEAELQGLKARVIETEEKIREEMKIPFSGKIHFRVGSMIELPAAALGADALARVGEFFAFGTNDLTQTTLGMSRDDSAHYLPAYLEKGLLPSDPFKVLSEPVKELVETAVRRGRRVRADSSFGICGEQGGDQATLSFCLEIGLNYVSCSPFRVLPARVSLVRVALTELAATAGSRNAA